MPHLLFAAPAPATTAVVTRIGGVPLAPRGTSWPNCKSCKGAMQFLAQVRLREIDATLPDRLVLLFMCQNKPGMCDDFAPTSGGNAVIQVPVTGLEPMSPPGKGNTKLDQVEGVTLHAFDAPGDIADAYESAREKATGKVLGLASAAPAWLQGDETPYCKCGNAMRLVVQLEDAGGGGINFGDAGCGYAFVCTTCPNQAQFLWQCC